MSEKRLLPAAALLMNSLKIIGNENMKEIGALSDLKSYLLSQETVGLIIDDSHEVTYRLIQSLREILLEELNAHLFLKTFWCDSRWTPYTPNQQDCERKTLLGYTKLTSFQSLPSLSTMNRLSTQTHHITNLGQTKLPNRTPT